MKTWRGFRTPAAWAFAIALGAPIVAEAQQGGLFPLAPIRREGRRVPWKIRSIISTASSISATTRRAGGSSHRDGAARLPRRLIRRRSLRGTSETPLRRSCHPKIPKRERRKCPVKTHRAHEMAAVCRHCRKAAHRSTLKSTERAASRAPQEPPPDTTPDTMPAPDEPNQAARRPAAPARRVDTVSAAPSAPPRVESPARRVEPIGGPPSSPPRVDSPVLALPTRRHRRPLSNAAAGACRRSVPCPTPVLRPAWLRVLRSSTSRAHRSTPTRVRRSTRQRLRRSRRIWVNRSMPVPTRPRPRDARA